MPKDDRLLAWARVDRLAPFRQRKRQIPLRHRVLAIDAVGNVGIAADGILGRDHLPEFGNRHVTPRPVDDTGQPGRVVGLQDGDKFS